MMIKNMAAAGHVSEHDYLKPHRDDHYLLMIATVGHFIINIDFENITVKAPAMLLILPGQIHHMVSSNNPSGWGISIDPVLVEEDFQLIMEKGFQQVLSLNRQTEFYDHVQVLMGQMEKLQAATPNKYTTNAIHSLLDALLALIAGELATVHLFDKTKDNRAAIIEQAFVQLVKMHYKDWKRPAPYATALNISVAHLYDTIKNLTGDSATAYIQQYCILEAKRLLCFTKLTVREIGYQLGYDEPVYFGKLFKKVTGFTPLQFRQQYRD